MRANLLTRSLSIALTLSLLVMTALASTVPNRPSPAAKTEPAATTTAPAAAPPAQATSLAPKPHPHWPRVSLLKTIVIVGVVAAVTGIIVWRSYKVPYACGACTPSPAP